MNAFFKTLESTLEGALQAAFKSPDKFSNLCHLGDQHPGNAQTSPAASESTQVVDIRPSAATFG